MSKFFVQALLSLVVAAGAAVGFRPDVRGELQKTYREVKAFTHELTQSIFDHASNVGAAADVSLESEVDSEVDADLDLDKASDLFSEAEGETELSAESDAELDVETNSIDLELEGELESELHLGVGLDN